MYSYSDRRLDMQREKREQFKRLQELKTLSPNLKLENYLIMDESEKLDLLLEMFKQFKPDYVENYNKMEEKKSERVQISIPRDYDLKDLIKSVDGEIMLQKALEIYYSNKVAHYAEYMQKAVLRQFLKRYQSPENLFGIIINDPHMFGIINNSLFRIFDEYNQDNTREIKYHKDILKRNGIQERELRILGKTIPSLVNIYRDAMCIKDAELHEIISLLEEDELSSYGMITHTEVESGKEKERNLFVLDVPFFGQMSVHIKSPELISQLGKHKYPYPVYQRESILLTDKSSPEQERIVKRNDIEEIRKYFEEGEEEFAHLLAIKGGYTADEIKYVHGGDNKGER